MKCKLQFEKLIYTHWKKIVFWRLSTLWSTFFGCQWFNFHSVISLTAPPLYKCCRQNFNRQLSSLNFWDGIYVKGNDIFNYIPISKTTQFKIVDLYILHYNWVPSPKCEGQWSKYNYVGYHPRSNLIFFWCRFIFHSNCSPNAIDLLAFSSQGDKEIW